MKIFLSLILLMTIPFAGQTQSASLSNGEVLQLRNLIKNNPDVKVLFLPIKKAADNALIDDPNPIDTVVSEGHLSNHPKKISTLRSLKDVDKIYALALTYKIESKEIYLKKAISFLTAWAITNQPVGNPINDTKFENLLIAYDLIKSEIPSEQKTIINHWLIKMADAEINTGKLKTKTTSFNNWNSHRLKVIGYIAYILDNQDYKQHIDNELPIQIAKNLYPDGTGFDFKERDALHYHVYTLEPLISLATIIKRASGKDYYNYISSTGSSVKKSIDFLIPFVTGEKTHDEYVNSRVSFDKKRAENKEPGFVIGSKFKPEHGINVLTEAAYFQPDCMDIVREVTKNTNQYPNWRAVLNSIMK